LPPAGGGDAFGLAFGARLGLVSAAAAKTANMNRPSLVARSKFSVRETTFAPRWRSWLITGQHVRGRPSKPVGLPAQERIAALNLGHAGLPPGPFGPATNIVSVNSRSYPCAARASCCSCGFWSRLEMRP
jgi:hypothetical protein